jgi:hypothetical protein
MKGLILIKAESFGWSEKVNGEYVPLPLTRQATEAQVVEHVFARYPEAHAVQFDRDFPRG